jgi:hypothetical protein
MPQFEVEQVVEDEFGFDDFFGFGAAASEVDPEIQQLFEDYDSGDIEDDDLSVDEEPGINGQELETQ